MQPNPTPLETRLDSLWSRFATERTEALRGDREAANRAARCLNLYFEEFQHPDTRWPRHPSGRLLMPREIAEQRRHA